MDKIKSTKTLLIIFLVFLFATSVYLAQPMVKQAQAQIINSAKDSDYDGLSDQVEINTYQTDPNKADTDGDGYLDSAEVINGTNPLVFDLTSAPNNAVNQPDILSSLPWYVARAAGISTYILMFLVVFLGTGMTTSFAYKYVNPVQAWVIHKYLGMALGISLLIHILSLSFDKFINFSWGEILIPFFSNYKPLYLNFGIFSLYILLIVLFTSLIIRLKFHKTWRGIHYAVYPLFIFSFIHGFFIGSDSGTLIMRWVYGMTGAAFLLLLLYRFIFQNILNSKSK